MRITSTANPVVRHARSFDSADVRREEQAFLIEGVRLVAEALRVGPPPRLALFDPEALAKTPAGMSLLDALPRWADRLYEVDGRVLKAAAHTEHPGGVLAILPMPQNQVLEGSFTGTGVILDGLADPGNAGTILRAADAFGAAFVAAISGTVDLFSPKVVRAAKGAHFRMPLLTGVSWFDLTDKFSGAEIIAAAAGYGESVVGFPWPARHILVIGSEANGLSESARGAVDRVLHIPMRPGVESLNAAVAASIMLFSAYSTTESIGA